MKIIGITGGIGSGKSQVLNLLKTEYNAYIVETDVLAHQLMKKGTPAYNRILEVFGQEVTAADGELNRKVLGEIVFHDEEKLSQLNQIVHPAVKEHIIKDIVTCKQEGRIAFYVIEAALLIQDGYQEICDELWYVWASKEVRLARLLQGRGGNRQKWLNIMENQEDDEYYLRNCEQIVNNDDNFVKTANVVKKLLFSTR